MRWPPWGDTTFDIYLNGRAYWRNVPANVWGYKLGGYQVLKKWLSYRESKVLGRPLAPEEVQHFTGTARRTAAVLMLTGKRAALTPSPCRERRTAGPGSDFPARGGNQPKPRR